MKNKLFSAVVAATVFGAVFSGAAFAHQAGDFIVRAGTATVAPSESSDNVLGLGEFGVDNNTQLGLNFGYMLTDNIGVELLAATPFSHTISLPNGVGDIAETKQLPPTLVAQYYFGDSQSVLRPYIGVGINFTNFYDNDFNANGKSLGLSDLSMSNSWGVAAQVGLDYQLNKNWLLNASVWYAKIDTDVKFSAGGVVQDTISTDIDPWVYMLSVGYTF